MLALAPAECKFTTRRDVIGASRTKGARRLQSVPYQVTVRVVTMPSARWDSMAPSSSSTKLQISV